MGITLHTKKGTSIQNETYDRDPAEREDFLNSLWEKKYPEAKLRRGHDNSYNCHGLTFANRRTCINEPQELDKILKDDGYRKIDMNSVVAGDIIVYKDQDGEIVHTGIVIEITRVLFSHMPTILSKWGKGPECIHKFNYVPEYYNTCEKEFWTERETDG